MTNIRFTLKSRHPRRSIGGNSPGQKGQEENKSVFLSDTVNYQNAEKKNSGIDSKKQNQLNFK
jgi:hypothetical protein